LRFLIDEQLPPALALALGRKGHEARHLRDAGLAGASDNDICAFAAASGAVLISKTEDFVDAATRGALKLVWIRLGNVSNVDLWRALEPVLGEIVEALGRGETLVEVI
jgi:predicted nuclease of predicted toxin-antitoxin system